MLMKRGYELRRCNHNSQSTPKNSPPVQMRTTMDKGLEWLAANAIQIGTVLDIGASNGCWTEKCRRFYPDAEYVLYEPQPVHSDALDDYAASRPRIKVVKEAVGATVGQTFFEASSPFGGALASSGEAEHTIVVGMTTLDRSSEDLNSLGPFLVKLDTHGYELSILSGASKVLSQSAALIIEAYNYKITPEAPLFWELCSFLDERGFRPIDLVDVMHRKRDNSLWQMDLIFLRSDWQGFDYTSYK